jgi:hypothetical protein
VPFFHAMGEQEAKVVRPLDILSLFESGTLTIGVSGVPLLKVDAEARNLELDASGVKESGLKLSKIMEIQGGQKGFVGLMKGSESTARGLSEKGWKLTLYDKGSEILTLGRGVSRLTGYVHANPLKLRRIWKTLG